MNTKTKSTLALVLAVSTGFAASAGAAEDRAPVTCHGKAATFVGSEGADVLTDDETDFGRNPVIVLAGGNDELQLGVGYRYGVDSLTVCAGDGNDSVAVYQGIGGRAQILLDGGLGNDTVGNNGGSVNYSDIPGMSLIGGDGNDTLSANASGTLVFAGRGDDTVNVNAANAVIYGGTGTNTINLGNTAQDTIVLQQGGLDQIYGFNLRSSGQLDVSQVLAEAQLALTCRRLQSSPLVLANGADCCSD